MDSKSKIDENTRLEQIPILHVRGTHFKLGFIIGRQFKTLIEDVFEKSEFFNKFVLPAYETEKGKCVYDANLKHCTEKFPGYMKEIEGIATGSKIPFYKVFLFNLEFFISSPDEGPKNKGEGGCSAIMCNMKDNIIIGHTEDAGPELLNNVFIVSAEIISEDGQKLEKFTSLTYAGCLPCFTMGFNEHFVYSINTLYPLKTYPEKTPRSFLARALLGCSTLEGVLDILRDKGSGITDGFSLNIYFANQVGPNVMYNIEISPNPDAAESIINVLQVQVGESYAHCNKFLRLEIPELARASISSVHRHEAIKKHPKPISIDIIKEILSDRTDPFYAVFRNGIKPDLITTVAVGIFDITNRKWSIYIQPPNISKPVVVIPLDF